MKRSKQKRKTNTCKIIAFPAITFTFEMVQVIQEALALVSAGLAIMPSSSPNRLFGLETTVILQEKFHAMTQQDRMGYPMPLDENEIILLHTAMLLFSYHLQGSYGTERRNACIICEEVRQQLPPLSFPLPQLRYN